MFKFPSPLGVLGLTTLKIRGQRIVVEMFPSPLGVLGLTTRAVGHLRRRRTCFR
ncbi:hypothetical protein BIT17_4225, partial [Mycobacterium tuberculosis variant bovis]